METIFHWLYGIFIVSVFIVPWIILAEVVILVVSIVRKRPLKKTLVALAVTVGALLLLGFVVLLFFFSLALRGFGGGL